MLQPRIFGALGRGVRSSPFVCLRCQQQPFRPRISWSPLRTLSTTRTLRSAPKPDQSAEAAEGENAEQEFVPKPLGRPIGFPTPPRSGENTGVKEKPKYTGGTMSERNLEKRKDIVEKWGQNYFRDFKNIRKHRSGKTFMANTRLFRREAALYFPNFHGETLASPVADTTDVLKGKISVVRVYSSQWGQGQADSFTSQKHNPGLVETLQAHQQIAQVVDVNVEQNTMKAWIIKLFQWRLRSTMSKEDWGRYFVVRKGVEDRIREAIGLLNGRVGYIYLLDEDCKIRWAGSGYAEGTENDDLVKGLTRLIQEYRSPTRSGPPRARTAEKVDEELEAQAVNAGAS